MPHRPRNQRTTQAITAATLLGLLLATVGPLVLSAPAAHAQETDLDPEADAEEVEIPEPGEQSVGGRLVDQEELPVVGVTITVETEDGELIESVESDENGIWVVAVPEPGRMSVTLDTDTLPEGVDLQDPDRSTLTPNVRPGSSATVIFAIGERQVEFASRLDRLSNLTAEGLKFGLMIALGALGLSMVYGVTGLVNFAHGELLAFGAVVAFWLERGYGPFPTMPLVLAAAIAVVLSAGFAGLWEVGIFGPVRRRRSGDIAALVISIGLGLVIRHLYLVLYGSRRDFYLDFRLQSSWSLGPVSLTPKSWITMAAATVVLVAVGWALKNTRIGTAMRAVSVNKDLAESSGIDVSRVVLATWIVGGALAGLSGVFFGIAESIRWNMGDHVLLMLFSAVILGGLGTAYGAMFGGLVVGLVTQLSTYWFPAELKLMFALLVLVIILLVRPHGILGVRERFG